MSGLIGRLRARIKGEDKYAYAIEDADKVDHCERWDAIRLARRKLFAPALFGAIGGAGLLGEVRDAAAQTTTPFLTWPFKGTPVTKPGAVYSPLSMRPQPSRVFDTAVLVNEFYPALRGGAAFNPQPYGTVANNASNTLDNFYSTAALATADYPFLSSYGATTGNLNTFEVDWCAWMAALLYAYNRDGGVGVALIRGQGGYVTKHTIQTACSATLQGEGTQFSQTSIRWNGTAGTVDAPNYILWAISQTVGVGTAVPQPGSSLPPQTAASLPIVRDLLFYGLAGNMNGTTGSESNYISGINIATYYGFTIERCQFHGTLWDGICVTGFGIWSFIRECIFSACYRDGIQYTASGARAGGSTTMTITNNNFSVCGRYHILINMFTTAAGAHPVILNNVHEPLSNATNFSNFFSQNPQWYVHGVTAYMCFIQCQQMVLRDPYVEVHAFNAGVVGFIHLIACPFVDLNIQGTGPGGGPLVISDHMNPPTNSAMTCSGTTLTMSGTPSGFFYPGMGLTATGLPVGTTIVSVPAGNQAGVYTISGPGATISTATSISATTRTAGAITYEAANGFWDVTDKRNFWAASNSTGGNPVTSATTYSVNFVGSTEISTAGGVTIGSPMVLTLSGMGFMFDMEVNPATGLLALAVCTAGSTSATGPTLTVAGAVTGTFKTGQYILLSSGAMGSSDPGNLFMSYQLGTKITSGGPGGAGTYGLAVNPPAGGTSQTIWAINVTSKGVYQTVPDLSGTGLLIPTASSLTQLADPAGYKVYIRGGSAIECRHLASDNVDEWMFFNSTFVRPGLNNNVDGSAASKYNGYRGFFMNVNAMQDFTGASANFIDLPMFYINAYDSSGVAQNYAELAGAVFSSRKIRYNFAGPATSLPTTGNWKVNDIIYYNNPLAAGFVGGVCTAVGPPVVWHNFGAVV